MELPSLHPLSSRHSALVVFSSELIRLVIRDVSPEDLSEIRGLIPKMYLGGFKVNRWTLLFVLLPTYVQDVAMGRSESLMSAGTGDPEDKVALLLSMIPLKYIQPIGTVKQRFLWGVERYLRRIEEIPSAAPDERKATRPVTDLTSHHAVEPVKSPNLPFNLPLRSGSARSFQNNHDHASPELGSPNLESTSPKLDEQNLANAAIDNSDENQSPDEMQSVEIDKLLPSNDSKSRLDMPPPPKPSTRSSRKRSRKRSRARARQNSTSSFEPSTNLNIPSSGRVLRKTASPLRKEVLDVDDMSSDMNDMTRAEVVDLTGDEGDNESTLFVPENQFDEDEDEEFEEDVRPPMKKRNTLETVTRALKPKGSRVEEADEETDEENPKLGEKSANPVDSFRFSPAHIVQLLQLDLVGSEVVTFPKKKAERLLEFVRKDPSENCIEWRKGKVEAMIRSFFMANNSYLGYELKKICGWSGDAQEKHVLGSKRYSMIIYCYKHGCDCAEASGVRLRKDGSKMLQCAFGVYKRAATFYYCYHGDYEKVVALWLTKSDGAWLEDSHNCEWRFEGNPASEKLTRCWTWGHCDAETSARNAKRRHHQFYMNQCDCREKCVPAMTRTGRQNAEPTVSLGDLRYEQSLSEWNPFWEEA